MNNIRINTYKDALVEVDAVLECLDKNEYKKIPIYIIENIKNNKNEDYIFDYNKDLNYEEWNLMPESKAILYNIIKKYIATDDQKVFLVEREKFEKNKIEETKKMEYNIDDIFDAKKSKAEELDKSTDIVKYKENIFSKIKKFIKHILKA